MKQLRKEFTGIGEVRGFTFRQISLTKWGFLYEVDFGGTKYYEVFKKRVNTQFNNVSYPSSKAFGLWAWTTSDFERAEQILNSFNNN